MLPLREALLRSLPSSGNIRVAEIARTWDVVRDAGPSNTPRDGLVWWDADRTYHGEVIGSYLALLGGAFAASKLMHALTKGAYEQTSAQCVHQWQTMHGRGLAPAPAG